MSICPSPITTAFVLVLALISSFGSTSFSPPRDPLHCPAPVSLVTKRPSLDLEPFGLLFSSPLFPPSPVPFPAFLNFLDRSLPSFCFKGSLTCALKIL